MFIGSTSFSATYSYCNGNADYWWERRRERHDGKEGNLLRSKSKDAERERDYRRKREDCMYI